jgi:hypothetical protein
MFIFLPAAETALVVLVLVLVLVQVGVVLSSVEVVVVVLVVLGILALLLLAFFFLPTTDAHSTRRTSTISSRLRPMILYVLRAFCKFMRTK